MVEDKHLNRPRALRSVEKALRKGGLHICSATAKSAIVDLLLGEEAQHRRRCADMISQAAEHYGDLNEDALKRLAYAVEFCIVDDLGQITLPLSED